VFDHFYDDAIKKQKEIMRTIMVHAIILICWLAMSFLAISGYPIESKPLNNNPDTWNFGVESWMFENDSNPSDPSASALVSSDPHVKKSKITPKSIFIAPNANGLNCPKTHFHILPALRS
jgi:hypothetical protein